MPEDKAWERWNTHFSTVVEQEVMGITLRLAQDPSSEHLGTTVWDASIVMAKYFEKNMRKGEFSRTKVSGKTAIELGAGMGLGGLALAMLGADVTLTDVKEVLPLLRRNYEQNLSPAAIRASGAEGRLSGNVGPIRVAELDWADPRHLVPLSPPYDLVLAADCIYHETLLRDLYRVMLALTSERSTVLIANERRSESVQSAFLDLFGASFTLKKVPASKQDPEFSHPAIELWLLKRKKGAGLANLLQLEAKEAADLVAAMEALTMLAAGPGEGGGKNSSSSSADGQDRAPEVGSVNNTAAAGQATVATPAPEAAAAAAAAAGRGQSQSAAAAMLQAAGAVEAAAGGGPRSTAAPSSSSSSSRIAAVDGPVEAGGCPATPCAGVSRQEEDVDMMDASPAAACDTGPSSRPTAATAHQSQQQQQPCRASGKTSTPAGHAGDQGLVDQCNGGVASCGDGHADASQLSWATRRQGSMAARLLADVQVPK